MPVDRIAGASAPPVKESTPAPETWTPETFRAFFDDYSGGLDTCAVETPVMKGAAVLLFGQTPPPEKRPAVQMALDAATAIYHLPMTEQKRVMRFVQMAQHRADHPALESDMAVRERLDFIVDQVMQGEDHEEIGDGNELDGDRLGAYLGAAYKVRSLLHLEMGTGGERMQRSAKAHALLDRIGFVLNEDGDTADVIAQQVDSPAAVVTEAIASAKHFRLVLAESLQALRIVRKKHKFQKRSRRAAEGQESEATR